LLDESGNQPREAFFGGAAGGGKSQTLLMAAAQYVEVPGYSALILRKTLPDLNQAGALIPRSHEWWLGTDAVWHENKKRWLFPSGATIRFGYLEKRSDLDNYMGSEYQYVGFDEATQFTLDLYRFLFSRLRKPTDLDVPLRVRAGSNPGGIGATWVKQRFLEPPAPGEPKRFFVPSRLSDNPSIDYEEYKTSLDELDPITRAQLLEGDWEVGSSAGNFMRGWYDIMDAHPTEWERLVRYWDTASTAPLPGQESKADWTVGTLMGRMNGIYWILDVNRFQGNAATVENAIYQQAVNDGQWVEIFMEQEPGASGKIMIEHYQFRVLQNYNFYGIRSTGPKPARAARFSAQSAARNVKLLRGNWIPRWLDEHESFPFGEHDDQVDSAAGAFNVLTGGGELRRADQSVLQRFNWRASR